MASVQNSFDLLLAGIEDGGARPSKATEGTSSQNKKRRARARAKNQAINKEEPDSSQIQGAADASPPASTEQNAPSINETADPQRASKVQAAEAKGNTGRVETSAMDVTSKLFVAAGKPSGASGAAIKPTENTSSLAVPSNDAPSGIAPSQLDTMNHVAATIHLTPGPVEAEKSGLEAAARAYAGIEGRRVQLWYEWIARGRTTHAEPQFGSLSWKQVLLQSEALEITVASCLQPPLSPSDRHHLQSLLAAFLGSPEAAQVMAQVVQDLAQGLAGGSGDGDLLRAAQQALTSSLAALKEGETGWAVQALAARLADLTLAEKLNQLGSKATEAEQQLNQLRADPNEMATLPERARLSQQLVSMSEQRLLLLLPEDAPEPAEGSTGNAPAARALHSIRQLAAQIRQRRTQASEPAGVPSQKKPAVSREESLQAAAERQRELQLSRAQLAEEAAGLQMQLAAAEKEVERLRVAVAAMEARRQMVDAELEVSPPAVQEEGSELSGLEGQQGGQPSPLQLWCAQQLGVVHALEALLLRPPEAGGAGSSRPAEEAVGAVVCRAVGEHLQALAAHVTHKQQQLREAGQRLHFSQAKVASMQADLARLREQGKAQLARELEKPQETYLTMTKEWGARVDAIMAEAEGVEGALQSPALRTAVALLPPQPPVHMLLNQIGHSLQQIRMEHSAIKAGPPAAPPEDPANGGHAQRPAQRPSAAGRRRQPRDEGGSSSAAAASAQRGEGGVQKGRRNPAATSGKLPETASNGGHVAAKPSHGNGHFPAPVPKENAWGVQKPRSSASELAVLGFQVRGEEPASSEGPDLGN